jgi:Protein of unknown function (DUF2848)
MSTLTFTLPDGSEVRTEVAVLLNAGYAGRDQSEVRAHIEELAALGVPAPTTTPALYPVSPYLAQQTSEVAVQHGQTSGEAEWAVVITGGRPEDVLITAACDHTDRALEVHGVAWSKNAGPDVLGTKAWRLVDVADQLDQIRIVGRVGAERTIIQESTFGALLPPQYWLDVLAERGDAVPGTVLISGTVAMKTGVDQFRDRWEVELIDDVTGDSISCSYQVVPMPAAIG